MQRVRLELEPDEYSGLVRLSEREIRPVSEQIRYIVRQRLEAAGLLIASTPLTDIDHLPAEAVGR
jgi:hypothetical protein